MTPKQKRFVDEYLKNNMNGARAAVAAGYSPKTARFMASENLTKPNIKAEVKRRLNELAMPAEEVISRLASQARAEYSDYMTEDGVDLRRLLADGNGHLVKSIKKTQHGTNVEFYDAQKAVELLGKYHSLFVDRIDSQSSGDIKIEVVYDE